MVSSDFAQIMSLHAGEAYAVQNLTRTDRLGLLLSGKVRYRFDLLYWYQKLFKFIPYIGYSIVYVYSNTNINLGYK